MREILLLIGLVAVLAGPALYFVQPAEIAVEDPNYYLYAAGAGLLFIFIGRSLPRRL